MQRQPVPPRGAGVLRPAEHPARDEPVPAVENRLQDRRVAGGKQDLDGGRGAAEEGLDRYDYVGGAVAGAPEDLLVGAGVGAEGAGDGAKSGGRGGGCGLAGWVSGVGGVGMGMRLGEE